VGASSHLAKRSITADPDNDLVAVRGELRRTQPVVMKKVQLTIRGRDRGDRHRAQIDVIGQRTPLTVGLLQQMPVPIVLVERRSGRAPRLTSRRPKTS
jgi:hypothetical protein